MFGHNTKCHKTSGFNRQTQCGVGCIGMRTTPGKAAPIGTAKVPYDARPKDGLPPK